MQAERTQEANSPRPVLLAILDVVLEQPAHRGDIVRRVEAKYGGLLPVSDVYVRRLIRRSLKTGLLEEMPLDDDERGRPQPRVRLRATPAGARAFREWRSGSPSADIVDLRQRLNAAATDTARLDIIASFEGACLEALASQVPLPFDAGLDEAVAHETQRLTLTLSLQLASFARGRIESAS